MNCYKYIDEKVQYVNKLVSLLYEDLDECCGGLLHIVLDDGNLEDDHINWCIEYCNKEENNNRADKYICLDIAYKMLEMNMYQRKLVYYMDMRFECCLDCDSCVIEREDQI